MSIETSDNATRRALRGAIKLMALVGVVAVVYAFSRTLFTPQESSGSEALRVALAEIPPGAARQFEWEGRRYLVLHRSPQMLALIDADGAPKLADPDSRRSRQPEAAHNVHRSVDPRYLVVLDYDTALNCPLEVVLPDAPLAGGWPGGLRDTCGGSRYDFAGRVLEGQRAVRNLAVPEHRFDGTTLEILDD